MYQNCFEINKDVFSCSITFQNISKFQISHNKQQVKKKSSKKKTTLK